MILLYICPGFILYDVNSIFGRQRNPVYAERPVFQPCPGTSQSKTEQEQGQTPSDMRLGIAENGARQPPGDKQGGDQSAQDCRQTGEPERYGVSERTFHDPGQEDKTQTQEEKHKTGGFDKGMS